MSEFLLPLTFCPLAEAQRAAITARRGQRDAFEPAVASTGVQDRGAIILAQSRRRRSDSSSLLRNSDISKARSSSNDPIPRTFFNVSLLEPLSSDGILIDDIPQSRSCKVLLTRLL